jgi:hypothetical protein
MTAGARTRAHWYAHALSKVDAAKFQKVFTFSSAGRAEVGRPRSKYAHEEIHVACGREN